MLRLIVNSLLRRRWQSLATILGVALGAGLLLAVFLLYRGFERGLERGRQQLGADLLVVPGNATVDPDQALFAGSPLSVYMDKKYADQARKIPGVRRVEAQFFTQSLKLECCSLGTESRLIGIEDQVARRLAGTSPDGREKLEPDEVIVGSELLGGIGKPGALIELLGDIFRLAYRLEPTGTALDHSILMPMDSARNLAAKSEALKPVWQKAGDPHELISALLIEVDNPSRIKDVGRTLEDLGPLKVIRAADTFQRLKRLMTAFVLLLAAAGALTALGGIAYLLGHFSSVAWDRKGEWALYRALGASKPRMAQLVVGEAVALALGGALMGLPLGYGLYRLAFAQLTAQNAFPFIAPGGSLLVAAAAGTLGLYSLIGLLSAAVPAFRVAQLEPALTMAQGDID
jgi:putative ABC transport system permease protein